MDFAAKITDLSVWERTHGADDHLHAVLVIEEVLRLVVGYDLSADERFALAQTAAACILGPRHTGTAPGEST